MQNLPKRLSRCILKGEPFLEGSEYISFLDFDGNRRDFCLQCWESTDHSREGHFWKGKIPIKKEKSLHPDLQALELFRQIKDPKRKYLLALYLLRKGQLSQRTRTVYELPETGEIFIVESIAISTEEGEEIASEIEQLVS